VKARVDDIVKSGRVAPHLVVVLASDDPASAIYVRNKGKACAQVGIRSTQHNLDPGTSPTELLELVHKLNEDPDVDGILVQLPLPSQHDTETVIRSIRPDKDVDGLHPENAGRLSRGEEAGVLVPCTPRGSLRLIEESGAEIKGARAVVVGRSRLVGRPMADLLLNRHATVTVCHSRTKDLPDRVRESDIVVAALGRARVRPGAAGSSSARRSSTSASTVDDDGKLVGDVAFAPARERASRDHPRPQRRGPHDHRLPARQRRHAPTKRRRNA
jgi:methylenetetrahydrofolate dehydrogenase (NADP+)/methenyltetrahydrofolate cyclohydrolase